MAVAPSGSSSSADAIDLTAEEEAPAAPAALPHALPSAAPGTAPSLGRRSLSDAVAFMTTLRQRMTNANYRKFVEIMEAYRTHNNIDRIFDGQSASQPCTAVERRIIAGLAR